MINSKPVFTLLAAAFLAGCASGADPIAMAPQSISVASANSPYSGRIGETTVRGGDETSPLLTSEILSSDFKTALDEALRKAGFQASRGNLELFATILEVDQPIFGTSITVTMVVRYQIVNQSGQTVFDETITRPYSAAFSDAVLGVERLKLANEGAARANLTELLRVLGRPGSVRVS